ncbi:MULTISPECIES: hypothetical protein [unclassified Microbacterium]|uniref:hypothetical protein n=1 Tax=unclassified Microbacterium TaxID=2609290 RepID=UPI00109BE439|nr:MULTISPECIES: hypothetical protein [unclassified Microbacterium]
MSVVLASLTPAPATAAEVAAFRSSVEAVDEMVSRFEPDSALNHVVEVTASEKADGEFDATSLADGDPSSKWVVRSTAGWAQYRLDDSNGLERLVSYTLTSGNDAPERDPLAFRVLASTDGVDWATIDRRKDVVFEGRLQTLDFTITRPILPFKYLRLDIESVRGPSSGLMQLAGWEPKLLRDGPSTVPAPELVHDTRITVTAGRVEPGEEVQVTGTGFAPSEVVSFRIADAEPVAATTTDGGVVSTSLIVPEGTPDGVQLVTALGIESNAEARANLHVHSGSKQPAKTGVSLSTSAAEPVVGESVTLTATVFPSDAAGKVEFLEGKTVIGSAEVATGIGAVDVVIATSGMHHYLVRFTPTDPEEYLESIGRLNINARSASAGNAEIAPNAKAVLQGGTFELAGRGFSGGEEVSIVLSPDPNGLMKVVTDGEGAFRAKVTVPETAAVGTHSIVVTGRESKLEAHNAIKVTAQASAASGLASTGGIVPYAQIVLGLFLLSASALLALRHRQQG